MERDDEYKDFVDGLVSQIRVLNDMAVREYTPLVDDICRRIASQNEVERLLDYLFTRVRDKERHETIESAA